MLTFQPDSRCKTQILLPILKKMISFELHESVEEPRTKRNFPDCLRMVNEELVCKLTAEFIHLSRSSSALVPPSMAWLVACKMCK